MFARLALAAALLLAAEARASDVDLDGLPDEWELLHFGSLLESADGDFDHDELDNASEYIWGTDPRSPDTDKDGLSDGLELGGAGDADPSTTTNPLVADTDADGIIDGVEDCNGDGALGFGETAPWLADTDGDTLADPFEVGADPCHATDTDGDGTPDSRDLDSDNDGIPDADEAGDLALWTPPLDSDLDEIPDFIDDDSDNDGLSDTLEQTVDADLDGAPDPDADGDGIPNRLDDDSDNDGKPDAEEGAGDIDGDGIPNFVDPDDAEPPDGTDAGADATDSADGGTDAGADGTDGGTDGTDGGTDGLDGTDSTDSTDGLDGIDSTDGLDGTDSTDGLDGIDGTVRPWPAEFPVLHRPYVPQPGPTVSDRPLPSRPASDDTPGAAVSPPERRPTGALRGGLRCDAGPGGGNQGAVLLLAATLLLLLRRRGPSAALAALRRRRLATTTLAALRRRRLATTALVVLLAPSARAEGLEALSARLSAPGTGVLGGRAPYTLGFLGVSAGLSVEWLHDALRREGEAPADLVGDRAVLTTHLALGVWDGADVGVDVPSVLGTRGEALDGSALSPGLGDLRVWAKVAPLTGWLNSPVDLALIGVLVAPTGSPDALRGGGVLAGELELALGGLVVGRIFRLDGSVGYAFAGEARTLEDLRVGDTLTLGASAEARLLDERLSVSLRVFTRALANDPFGSEAETALEVAAAVAYRTRGGFDVALGGGVGVLKAAGSPAGRLMASFGWVTPRPEVVPQMASDRDGDGIEDAADRCPDEPEDLDGIDDDDGCPDPDDRDEDGIPDAIDKCPDEPEDEDDFEDDDGCPERDNDGDGVADIDDQCPLEPERPNGTLDRDGCPDADLVRLDVAGGRIEVLESALVRFEWDDAGIPKEYEDILDQVAFVMRGHPELRHLEIQGHSSVDGEEAYNLALSRSRAEAVVRGLVGRGIDAGRLESRGYGESRPKIRRAGKEWNWQNRRVEFVIKAGADD